MKPTDELIAFCSQCSGCEEARQRVPMLQFHIDRRVVTLTAACLVAVVLTIVGIALSRDLANGHLVPEPPTSSTDYVTTRGSLQ